MEACSPPWGGQGSQTRTPAAPGQGGSAPHGRTQPGSWRSATLGPGRGGKSGPGRLGLHWRGSGGWAGEPTSIMADAPRALLRAGQGRGGGLHARATGATTSPTRSTGSRRSGCCRGGLGRRCRAGGRRARPGQPLRDHRVLDRIRRHFRFQRTLRGCRSFSRSSRPRTAPSATDRPSRPRGGEDEFAFCGRNANSITNRCRTPGSSTPRQSGPGLFEAIAGLGEDLLN